MKYTNKHNLPDPLVQALIRDDYDAGGANRSVTALVGPPRIYQLHLRHFDKIVVDVANRLFMLDGKEMHYALEMAGLKNAIVEERLYCKWGGWLISGKPDCYYKQIVSDWKKTSVWKLLLGDLNDWEAQLNLYGWLFVEAGFAVDGLELWLKLRDWRRSEFRRDPKHYPPVPFKVAPVPIWSDDKLDKYLTERVAAHKAADGVPDDVLPYCTPEERWARSDKWAVMRIGRKTAVSVKDSQEEAEAMMKEKNKKPNVKKHHVEFRPGASVRCEEGFCEVAPFCNQYKESWHSCWFSR